VILSGAMESAGDETSSSVVTPREPAAGDVCIGCGYSLEGLSSSDVCPECGESAARSLEGSGLVYSTEGYVRRLQVWMRVEYVLSLSPIWGAAVALVGSWVWAVVAMAFASTSHEPDIAAYFGSIFMCVIAFSQVASSIAMWMTARSKERLKDPVSRRIGRFVMWTAAPAPFVVATPVLYYIVFQDKLPGEGIVTDWLLLTLGMFLARFVGWTTLMGRIAARVPAPRLARRIRVLRWAAPAGLACSGTLMSLDAAWVILPAMLAASIAYIALIGSLCGGLRDVRMAQRARPGSRSEGVDGAGDGVASERSGPASSLPER